MGVLTKRIEPKQGHAIFLPSRKEDRVVIGGPVNIWRWSQEEFKHVQLGVFTVTVIFGHSSQNPPVKTADNLPCKAQVKFSLRVNEDGDSLEKATRKCSVSREVSNIISHKFFEDEVRSELEAIVERCFRKVAYLDLLTVPERIGDVEKSVQTETSNWVGGMGFALAGCRVEVELIELDSEALARNSKLKERWNTYLDEKKAIQIEAKKREAAREEEATGIDLESKVRMTKMQHSFEVNTQTDTNATEVKVRGLQIEDEANKLKKKEMSAAIQRSMQAIDTNIQKETLAHGHDIKKLEISNKLNLEEEEKSRRYEQEKEESVRKAQLAEMKRQEEAKERQHGLGHLKNELELDELRTKQAELKQKIAETESKGLGIMGKAQADVEREKTLAAHAHTMKMNESLLNALPAIMERAYAPTEKLGEVKVLYFGGRNADSGGGTQMPIEHALGAILSSMSTIPMVKEVLSFLKGWEQPVIESHAHVQDRSASGKQHNRQTMGEIKEVTDETGASK